MRQRFAVVLFSFFLLLPLCSFPRAYKADPKFSKESIAEEEAREKSIRSELQDLKDHEWVGEYYYGDGEGTNVDLLLAPTSGFAFTWRGCLGLHDVNYGGVEFAKGKVLLHPIHNNTRNYSEGTLTELVPVRWGQRHYLIGSDQFIDFANAVNLGTEPADLRRGFSYYFLLRAGDEKKVVSGKPSLPAEFLEYLLAKPVHAEIVAVGESVLAGRYRRTYVTLNAGRVSGLRLGMEMKVHHPSRRSSTTKLTSVSESTSVAVIETRVKDPAPAVDWALSTKL